MQITIAGKLENLTVEFTRFDGSLNYPNGTCDNKTMTPSDKNVTITLTVAEGLPNWYIVQFSDGTSANLSTGNNKDVTDFEVTVS